MKSTLIFFIGFLLFACNFGNKVKRDTPQKFKDTDANLAISLKDYPIQENKDVITIKVPEEFKQSEGFMLDSLIDSIRYVPLETNKLSLIQYIEKVIPFEGNLFVLDMLSKVLLKFDANGKFVTQIGKNGKGPGEYIAPTSFEIINNQIIVWDDRSSKIIYYDIDGNFLMAKNLGFRMNHFIAFGKDKYICEIVARKNFHIKNINDYKLIFCHQPDWQVIGTADKYNADIEDGICVSRNTITQYGNQLVYNPSFEYSIYNIDEAGIHKKYLIDVGSHKLPNGYNQNISINEFVKKYMSSESDCMIIYQNVFETNDHLVGSFDYKKQMIPFYYSKKSGKLICNKYYTYSSRFPFGLVHQKNISGNTFIGYIDPSLILSARDRWMEHPDTMGQVPKNVKALADNVKVNDNPVLVFFTLKEF